MLDSNTLAVLTAKFLIATLIMIRISGMFVTAQFWGHMAIPMQVRMILILILTVAVAAPFWNEQPKIEFHLWYLVLLAAKEFIIGAAIGFSSNIVFWAARFAGGIIDFDLGYQTSTLFDPEAGAPTLVGEIYSLAAFMLFLFFNGHHFIIESLFMSIRAVPLTTFEFTDSTYQLMIKISTTILILGIKIAAPVLVAMFCTNLALALLARIAPQTNIFMLSFQVKIAIGLLVLFVTVPLLIMTLKFAMTEMQEQTMKIMMSMNPVRT